MEAIHHCPTCERRIDDEWIICPTCRTRLNRVCPNCSRLVGLDWSLCAWCGKDFERREVPVAAITAAVTPPAGSSTPTAPHGPAGRGRVVVDDRVRSQPVRAPRARPQPAQDALPER